MSRQHLLQLTRKHQDLDAKILKETPGVDSWFLIGGNSLLDQATASNAATWYLSFKPFEERAGHPEQSLEAILGHVMGAVQSIPECSPMTSRFGFDGSTIVVLALKNRPGTASLIPENRTTCP